jgi:hypothetical protein
MIFPLNPCPWIFTLTVGESLGRSFFRVDNLYILFPVKRRATSQAVDLIQYLSTGIYRAYIAFSTLTLAKINEPQARIGTGSPFILDGCNCSADHRHL